MFSDESLSEIEQIKQEITKLKVEYDAITEDQKILQDGINNDIKFTKEFEQRSVSVQRRLDDTRQAQAREVKKRQAELEHLKQEQVNLKTKLKRIELELGETDKTHMNLRQQNEVSTAVPEKKVAFRGEVAEASEPNSCGVKPYIVYPMEGGTAFITFEEIDVAEKVLAVKNHVVELGECRINVQAEPVQFLVPSSVEIDTQVCPCRVLVSNLPQKDDREHIMDKLEIYFSKSKNGGGEVVEVEWLDDSGNAVITFVEPTVGKRLTDKQIHEIEVEKGKKHKVKVTSFLNGEITQLETCNTTCSKTVLLTGIPDVMDKESLQDLLEIHFQKKGNSGGEVDAIVYNPLGERTLAVFEEDNSEDENV